MKSKEQQLKETLQILKKIKANHMLARAVRGCNEINMAVGLIQKTKDGECSKR